MRTKKFIALAIAAVTAVGTPLSVMADSFPDVKPGEWYASGVQWAADKSIVQGYPDGTFGVGRECTWQDAVVMLWRGAGAKNVGGETESDRAWAWLERQCGLSTTFAKGSSPISRLEFAYLIYLALGDYADIQTELPFTDVDFDSYGEAADEYAMALRFVFGKGILQGVTDTEFAPDSTLTREQVVTVLRRCYGEEIRYDVAKKSVPFYLGSVDERFDMELTFLDGTTEIPYIEINVFKALMENISNQISIGKYQKEGYALTVEEYDDRVILTRENGLPMILDFDTDTISFVDFDAFVRTTTDGTVMEFTDTSGFDMEGNANYLQILDSSSERYGHALKLDPCAYGLRLIHQDDEYYIPLQMVSDLFFTSLGAPFAYNGEAVFFTKPEGEMKDVYYSAPTGERSKALALFTYKELVFLLDTKYGLSKQHGITSFFDEIGMIEGMQEALLGADPAAADEALDNLTTYYLDDLHSGFNANSYLEGPEAAWKVRIGASNVSYGKLRNYAMDVRSTFYPDGVPCYEEVGDTAIITFDEFAMDGTDYYTTKPTDKEKNTIGVMLYAFSQITRKGSPVKNIVLDLSCNGGGVAQTAAFVLGMFLGEGSISVQNSMTGSQMAQYFRSDMNLDRKFDEKDLLEGYNLYCLTSPLSFSCGNLVPSVLKNSHKVTILGQTTGGGACIVMNASTADGAFFQSSGPYVISFIKNGSFYDVDQGVTPDVYIRDYANFYNRKELVDIIHGIR